MNLNLHPSAWTDASEADTLNPPALSRLHYRGGITINEIPFHVTAIRVVEVSREEYGYSTQEPYPTDRWVNEDFEAISAIDTPDTGWRTVRIGELDYILIILPYQR